MNHVKEHLLMFSPLLPTCALAYLEKDLFGVFLYSCPEARKQRIETVIHKNTNFKDIQ